MDEVLAEFCCGATTTQPNMLGAHIHLFEPFGLFKLSSFTGPIVGTSVMRVGESFFVSFTRNALRAIRVARDRFIICS